MVAFMLIFLSSKLDAQFLKGCFPKSSKQLRAYRARMVGKDWEEGQKNCFIFKPTPIETQISTDLLKEAKQTKDALSDQLQKLHESLNKANQTGDAIKIRMAKKAFENGVKELASAFKSYIVSKDRMGYELDKTYNGIKCYYFPRIEYHDGYLACQEDKALRYVHVSCGQKPRGSLGSYQDPRHTDTRCWVMIAF